MPTLLFGIPGSGSMAILLGGLILMGIQPGPSMAGSNLNVTLLIIWTLAFANIIGTAACFAIAKPVGRLTTTPAAKLMPFVLVIIVVAAYQSTSRWGDIGTLVAIGILGWVMKRLGWPRPPMLIGFVLATPAERYLWISMSRFGAEWWQRPGVLVIGALIVGLLFFGLRQARRLEAEDSPQVAVGAREADDVE